MGGIREDVKERERGREREKERERESRGRVVQDGCNYVIEDRDAGGRGTMSNTHKASCFY